MHRSIHHLTRQIRMRELLGLIRIYNKKNGFRSAIPDAALEADDLLKHNSNTIQAGLLTRLAWPTLKVRLYG